MIKRNVWLIGLLVPIILLYSYRLVSSYSFDSDFGRDLVDIYHITQGDLTLIGPKLSFGGIYAGPYYYYLFAPFLALTQLPEVLLWINAFLFMGGLILFGLILSQKPYRFTRFQTLLATYVVGLAPFYLFSARQPGNAFSYIPLLLVLLVIAPRLLDKKHWWWAGYGFLWGVIINTHLVSLLLFLPFIVMLLVWLGNKKRNLVIRWGLAFGVGVLLSFAPLLVFELRHDFVMFTNTFVHKSYQVFTQNENLPNPLSSSTNPLHNAWLLSNHFSPWTTLPFLLMLCVVFGLVIIRFKKDLTSYALYLGTTSLISFGLFSVAARSQLAFHYFFPFVMAMYVALIVLVPGKFRTIFIGGLFVFSLFSIPRGMYSPSSRQIPEYRTFTHQLVQTPLTNTVVGRPFNVFVARETPLAVYGHEYRYFLEREGVYPLEPTNYSQAEFLMLIDETSGVNLESLQSWELSEFGNRHLIDTAHFETRVVHLFSKGKPVE